MAALRRIFGRKIARWGIKQQQTIFRVENIFLQRATANKQTVTDVQSMQVVFSKDHPFPRSCKTWRKN